MKAMTQHAALETVFEPPVQLGRYLPLRITRINESLMRRVTRLYRERQPLSVPEWRLMAILGQCGAMSTVSVIAQTQMNKVRVSRVVTSLLNAGYITREVDRIDRRRAILALTQEGAKVYRQTLSLMKAFDAELQASLSVAERIGLNNALSKIEAHLEAR